MNDNKKQNEGAFPDELVSAYLDGELSPTDKLRVEEQLMDSAEHRQLFEELKSLRQGMQSLPKQTLGADFAARVLERAEKQLLADEVPTESKPIAAAAAAKSDDRGAWRGLIWSVSAMAAAIMLIVFSPWLTNDGNVNHRGVAVNQGTDDPSPATKPDEGEENLVEDRSELGQAAQRVDPNGSTATAVGAKDTDHGSSVGGQSVSDIRGRSDLQQAHERIGDRSVEPGGAIAGDESAVVRKSRDTVELASRSPQRELADGIAPAFSRFQQMHNVPALDAADQMAADMMVISVDVTPEALSEHFLDEMLAKHNIRTNRTDTWRTEDELAKTSLGRDLLSADKLAQNKNEKSKQDVQAQQGQPLDAETAEGQVARGQRANRDGESEQLDQVRSAQLENLRRQRSEESPGKAATSQGDVDVMVVVATPAQIDGLLSDMRSQSKYVLAMASDRPQVAVKKSQALSFRTANEAEKQLADDKALPAADSREEGLKETASGGATAKTEPQGNELAADTSTGVGAEGVSAVTDRASGIGGAGATTPADIANATAAAPNDLKFHSPAQLNKEAEDYRGIARRLHLPENFQKDLVPRNKQFANSADQFALPDAPAIQGLGQQQGQGGGQVGGGAALAPANNVPAGGLVGGRADVAAGGGFAAKREEQPLVRVLFVLRASGAASTAAAAAEPLLPADIQPTNAALKEAATEAAPAGVDE